MKASNKQFVLFLFLLPALLAVPGAAAEVQPGFAGHWEGKVDAPSGPTKISFDLDRKDNVWIASMGVPERQIDGIPVADIRVEENKLTFRVPLLPGTPAFSMTLAGSKLTGSLSARGESLGVEMERTGDARVVVARPDPAVSKELEGDWHGELALPDGQSRAVVVHFKNQADGTVKGTIDSPSQGATGLALAGVTGKGNVVEFRVWLYGGSYKGTLNKEATEIVGEWTQNQTAIALVLRKKQG